LIVGLTVAAVLPPTVTAISYVTAIGRTSTQAQAYRWLSQHVPEGTKVVVERYEVRLPTPRFKVDYVTRLVDRPYEEYRNGGVAYLVASSGVFGPVIAESSVFRELFDQLMIRFTLAKEVARFSPTPQSPGPEIIVFQVR